MADRLDIRIANNCDWSAEITLYDEDDALRDLTGATFEMDIRAKADDVAAIATLTTANGGVAVTETPDDGVVILMVTEAVAAAIAVGTYVHDMIMTIDGEEERIWYGRFKVEQGVTR